MATITTDDLIATVAEHLKVAAADIPLSDANSDKIEKAIGRVSAEYRELALIWWADDAIPAACEDAMKLIVSARAAASCGKAGQGYETGEPQGRLLLSGLRESAKIDTLKTVYY